MIMTTNKPTRCTNEWMSEVENIIWTTEIVGWVVFSSENNEPESRSTQHNNGNLFKVHWFHGSCNRRHPVCVNIFCVILPAFRYFCCVMRLLMMYKGWHLFACYSSIQLLCFFSQMTACQHVRTAQELNSRTDHSKSSTNIESDECENFGQKLMRCAGLSGLNNIGIIAKWLELN